MKAIQAWRELRDRCTNEIENAPDGRENWSLANELVAAERRAVRAILRAGRRHPSGWTRAVIGDELFAVPPASLDGLYSRVVELGAM
jgi:hypothetical protein